MISAVDDDSREDIWNDDGFMETGLKDRCQMICFYFSTKDNPLTEGRKMENPTTCALKNSLYDL
jgi:hypothetical protein